MYELSPVAIRAVLAYILNRWLRFLGQWVAGCLQACFLIGFILLIFLPCAFVLRLGLTHLRSQQLCSALWQSLCSTRAHASHLTHHHPMAFSCSGRSQRCVQLLCQEVLDSELHKVICMKLMYHGLEALYRRFNAFAVASQHFIA